MSFLYTTKKKKKNSDMSKRRLCSKGLQQEMERVMAIVDGADITVRSTTRHCKICKVLQSWDRKELFFYREK